MAIILSNLHISCDNMSVDNFGFLMYTIISFANYTYLLVSASHTPINGGDDSVKLLISDFKGKAFNISPLIIRPDIVFF